MELSKIKIGKFIRLVNEKNVNGEKLDFVGLNRNKTFMPTVASTNNLECKNYKILRKGYFVYSGMQTGRDNCIRLGLYAEEKTVLVSPAYTTFVVDEHIILSEYFYMIFNSGEMDRYGSFLSDGSIRANLDWDVFCNIEIELPSLEIQKKYVAVYNAMVANQKSYEKRLDDLKMTCEAYIEELRKENKCQCVGDYIELVKELNSDKQIDNVVGLYGNSFKQDGRKTSRDDISKYQIIREGCICYPPPHFGNVGTIGLYRCEKPALISPMYVTIKSRNTTILLPQYLMLWLGRKEFKRYAGFHSDGSIRDTFDYNELSRFKVPIPEINIQEYIVSVYDVLHKSEELNRLLQRELQQICPILIKGAVEEAQKQLQ